MMRAARWTSSVLAVVLAIPALGQDPPRFEADVDLVAVDAFVVDDDGRPVSDLAPAEFAVKVDGKPRPVVSVRFIETARPATPEAGPAPHVATALVPAEPPRSRAAGSSS